MFFMNFNLSLKFGLSSLSLHMLFNSTMRPYSTSRQKIVPEEHHNYQQVYQFVMNIFSWIFFNISVDMECFLLKGASLTEISKYTPYNSLAHHHF